MILLADKRLLFAAILFWGLRTMPGTDAHLSLLGSAPQGSACAPKQCPAVELKAYSILNSVRFRRFALAKM
jgi:hypothetical protein